MLIEDLLQYLRELLYHSKEKIARYVEDSTEFRNVPKFPERCSLGRPRYSVTAEQIEVLRRTGMQWTAIAKRLGISTRTLSRRTELGIVDYSDIDAEGLDRNVRDILRLTPFSGETYVRGALRARGIFAQRWKIREALQRIYPVNRAIRCRYSIQRLSRTLKNQIICGILTQITS